MESYDGMGGWNPSELLATSEFLSEVQEYGLDNYGQELETLLSQNPAQNYMWRVHGLDAESLPSVAESEDADNGVLRLDHSRSQSPPLVELDANHPGGGAAATRDKVQYAYRVKIINKVKKSDFITRDMRSYSGRFESVRSIKLKLMEQFDTLVPNSMDFDIGYFSGKQSKKQWLIEDNDLKEMYDGMKKNQSVLLWCDRRVQGAQQPSEQKRKRSTNQDAPKSKRFELETDIDDTVTQLKDIHGDKYSVPQMRMWARYIQAGHYKDLIEPPPLPAFKGVPPKRERKESLSDAIAGAAITFINAMRSPESKVKANNVVINAQTPPKNDPTTSVVVGISPGRATDLRLKKLKELRELQALLEQSILSEAEFIEQKAIVLESLRKLQ